MSVWTTKALTGDRNYIVIQHTLKGVNHVVNGVKFRDGYAVVEKDSKTYYMLKKVPVLRAAKEYPLIHLKKLKFITRTADIKMVFGQDVYRRFIEEEQKQRNLEIKQHTLEQEYKKELEISERKEEIKLKEDIEAVIQQAVEAGEDSKVIEELKSHLPNIQKCTYITDEGKLCGQIAFEDSPAKYCHHHIFNDPAVKQLGIEIPQLMTKKERKALREKIQNLMTKAKKKGQI